MMSHSSDIVVIGVGNALLSDDGVGVQAAKRLQQDRRVPYGITILDGGTLGLALVSYASDASRVLLLDAVDLGVRAGTLTRMEGRELLSTGRGVSVHQLGVTDLISALALVSTRPQEVVVWGVQPARTGWGLSLSSEVEEALPRLVDAAIAELQRWAVKQDGLPMTKSAAEV